MNLFEQRAINLLKEVILQLGFDRIFYEYLVHVTFSVLQFFTGKCPEFSCFDINYHVGKMMTFN